MTNQQDLVSSPIIGAGAALFKERFNRASFAFSHSLAHHPLLSTARLASLAERVLGGPDPQKFVAFNSKSADAATKFSALPASERLANTIRQLETSGSWLKLSRTQDVDPAYKDLLEMILHEIEDLTGVPLHEEITWSTLTVFLASPRIVTPYHIDHESNFLFQIEGEKEVCLFDPSDQDLLPAPEIEQFYVGNAEAANYRSHLQDRGTVYRLTPGMAVHHPPLAPHWVKNGDGVSVSASIGFCMRDLDRRAKVHQANLVLRKLGLHPQAPGLSRTGDRAKAAVMSVLSKSNPQTQDDLLFSGIRRAVAPFRALKRLRSRVGA